MFLFLEMNKRENTVTCKMRTQKAIYKFTMKKYEQNV